MYEAPYDVVEVDLTNPTPAGKPEKILDRGINIGDVAILELPPAAVGNVFLRIGSVNAKKIKLKLEGQNFHVYQQRVAGGLYLDHELALPGSILSVFVGIAEPIPHEILRLVEGLPDPALRALFLHQLTA